MADIQKRGLMSNKNQRKRGRPTLSENGEKSVKFTIRMPKGLRDRLKPVPADEIRYSLGICAARHEQGGLLDTRGTDQAAQGQAQGPSTPAGQPQGGQGVKTGWAAGKVDESAPGQGKVVQPDRRTAGPADPESLFIE